MKSIINEIWYKKLNEIPKKKNQIQNWKRTNPAKHKAEKCHKEIKKKS